MSIINKVTIRIILTFSVMMLMSVLTGLDPIKDLLGDYVCNDLSNYHYGRYWKSAHSHIGWTHWLYIFMGLCIFITQIVSVVIMIENKDKKI